MSIIRNSATFSTSKKTIVTVGTFDGVHLGHQEIITQVVERAEKSGLTAVLLTFDPHPRKVLQPNAPMSLIQTLEERANTLARLGLDHVVVHPFTKSFSQLSAAAYVEAMLLDMLNTKEIVIGHNHRFGKNRAAAADVLEHFGNIYDFSVTRISAQQLNNVSISSTKIRAALSAGDIATANAYLGHPFTLTGTVVKGQEKGRTIGFPTANILVDDTDKIIPKEGVYAAQVNIENKWYLGMMNIGTNPTVNGQQQSLEVHVIDWSGNLYEQRIQVAILDRFRDEVRFDSMADLQEQLKKDKDFILTDYKTLTL
ncbi:MAG: riboflavin biosynthesis protein RibF [Flavobacteriaceae bacterium]|nr:riboflavin biosynthesis protein RibF [Flavobacteriaceae bacterium]